MMMSKRHTHCVLKRRKWSAVQNMNVVDGWGSGHDADIKNHWAGVRSAMPVCG